MITEKQKQVLEMQDKAEDIEQELFRTEKSLSYAEVAHIVQYVFKLESDQVRDAIQALADFRRKEPTDSRLNNSCSWVNCFDEASNILHCMETVGLTV